MKKKETESKITALIYAVGMGGIWYLGGDWLVMGILTFLVFFLALNINIK